MRKLNTHRSGFINIIGQPNVGKSTLMNALVGERMSIITRKPQTTRHRIIGIVSGEDYQMVFSDTPGFIEEAAYKMQERMNAFVKTTFEDGDIMLLVVDATQDYDGKNGLFQRLATVNYPLFLILNKIDLIEEQQLMERIRMWNEHFDFKETFPISALKRRGTENLFEQLKKYLPLGPIYYPKDQFTDRPERFFINEIIREKILLNYYQEIPYACEVMVESFKENKEKNRVRIGALIFVARKSQKSILIGKGGAAIKQLGIEARKSIEAFLEKKVYLDLYVKVKENWRDDERELKNFGYI